MGATKILDTTIADTGPTYEMDDVFLRAEKPLRFSVDLSTGDVIVIYGRARSDDDWNVLHTFTDESPKDVYVSNEIRAVREVDGGLGDSEVFLQDPYYMGFSDHTA